LDEKARVGYLDDTNTFQQVPMFAEDSIAANDVDADTHIRDLTKHLTSTQATLISKSLQPELIGAPNGIAGLDENGDLINLPVRKYEHTQATPSNAWLVQHNLGGTPLTILAVNDAGEQIIGWQDTVVSTINLLVYRFSEPVTGKIYLKL